MNLSADPAVIDNGCSCHVVHTFHGSQTQTVLTRALLMTHPVDDSRMLVCAGEETSSGVGVQRIVIHSGKNSLQFFIEIWAKLPNYLGIICCKFLKLLFAMIMLVCVFTVALNY